MTLVAIPPTQKLLHHLERVPPVARLVLLASAAFLLYGIISFISLRQKRRSLQRLKGTLPAVQLPQSERIIGWRLFRENLRSLKNHTVLDRGKERFELMNTNTVEVILLGRKVFFTREPEILKTIQATDHKIWSLGKRRKVGFRPLLGDGETLAASDPAQLIPCRYIYYRWSRVGAF